MSDGAALRDNLAGATDVMRGRAEGLERMDMSVSGFWRSFAAVLFVLPVTVIGLVGWDSTVAASGAAAPLTEARVVAEIAGTLVNFALFPLVFAALAGPLGLGPRYVPFIVARNWAGGLIALAFAPIHALAVAGAIPIAAMPYVSLATLVVELRLLYVIARTALGTPLLMTLPIIVLDFLLSLVVWSAFDRLGGG